MTLTAKWANGELIVVMCDFSHSRALNLRTQKLFRLWRIVTSLLQVISASLVANDWSTSDNERLCKCAVIFRARFVRVRGENSFDYNFSKASGASSASIFRNIPMHQSHWLIELVSLLHTICMQACSKSIGAPQRWEFSFFVLLIEKCPVICISFNEPHNHQALDVRMTMGKKEESLSAWNAVYLARKSVRSLDRI